MPFIVPGVCRFTYNGSYEGRPIATVLDFRIDTTGAFTSRSEAIADQASTLVSAWSACIAPVVSNQFQLESVDWLDLDEADGSVGSISGGLPDSGALETAPFPGNVAVLITKEVIRQRGLRNGRWYQVGYVESGTATSTPNALGGGDLDLLQAAYNDWLDAANHENADPFFYDSNLCVVHILTREEPVPPATVGAPLTGESNDVTALSVQSLLATQRRRLRG